MKNRRDFLKVVCASTFAGFMPIRAIAMENTNRRFIFILQRGAADGLSTIVPYGDPNYQKLRPTIAIEDAIKLNDFFGIHPQLSFLSKLYEEKQASFFHAISTNYDQRSHFDGQNILEGGFKIAHEGDDGWINRFAHLIAINNPPMAFTPTMPLVLRGKNPAINYSSSRFPPPGNDLMLRLSSLYENDPKLYEMWQIAEGQSNMGGKWSAKPEETAKMVSGFMKGDKAANLLFLESNGWDTHINQNARLSGNFKSLDLFISTLKEDLGPIWNDTTILIATEFGRTAAQNGTQGTDHGTGASAIVLGGALSGGKIKADWPGLSKNQLFENRDLKTTNNLFGLIAGILGQTFNYDSEKIVREVFPKVDCGKILSV